MRRRAEHLHDGLRRDLEWRFVPFLLIVLSLSVFVPFVLFVPFVALRSRVPRARAPRHGGALAHNASAPGQVPHSRLSGVAADDGLDRVIVDLDLIGRQSSLLNVLSGVISTFISCRGPRWTRTRS